MDQAFERIKEIITSAYTHETAKLHQEITHLREQVKTLTTQLHEKDEQCRHIASVLHAKNAEWKQIKRKLSSAKKQNESFEGGAEGDIEVIIMNSEKNNCEQSDKMDSENIICVQNMNDCVQSGTVKYVDSDTVKNGDNTVSNTDNSIADDGLTQSPPTYDDCTQLPVQSTETQSHLDALIDLITDAEDTDLDTVVASNKENHRRSLSAMDTAKIQKRKSHSRGCACCDKFYSATRTASSHSAQSPQADSFPVSPNTPPGFWDTSFTPRQ